MRTWGPIISMGFYTTQILHAVLFATVFGPALHEKCEDYPGLAYLLQALGWFLSFKVTYLYYRVNTSSPGVPSKVLKQNKGSKPEKKPHDEKLTIDEDLAKRYSRDIAEILRYSPIAGADFETFENAMA